MFQGSLRDISRVLKKVLRLFQLRLRGVSSSFKGVSKKFQESFKTSPPRSATLVDTSSAILISQPWPSISVDRLQAGTC